MSVLNSLRTLVARNDFWKTCYLWKTERDFGCASGVLTNVFNGRVWHEFLYVDGQPFLASERTLGFLLNRLVSTL